MHTANFGNLVKRIKCNLQSIPPALTGKVYARWCQSRNFGDALNPLLIEKICGSRPVDAWTTGAAKLIQDIKGRPDYIVIGSTLQWCGQNSVVWGAGFLYASACLPCRPRQILAVRGPLTRQKLIAQGVDCPEIFGDPALLLPQFVKWDIVKSYTLGVIPHYADKSHPFLDKIRDAPGVLIIDVQQDPLRVMTDLLSCERIASSSLHGIIVADAYRIPSLWVKFSDNLLGGDFKFRDYFTSMGTDWREMVSIQQSTTISELIERVRLYDLNIDLDKLWQVCPLKASI